jgi:mono/diheme cytochrome c family protein
MVRMAQRLLACTMTLLAAPPIHAADSSAARALAVLEKHCAACHGPQGSSKGGFSYVLDRERLIGRDKVLPGKAAESPLFQRLRDGEMPPPGKRTPPSADEIALVKRWIDDGAPPFAAAPAAAAVVRLDALTSLIQRDLENLDPRRRRFTRYLTLNHLAALPAADLERERHALAKLVNSLSWHPRPRRPEPIDAARTVYRLDLRDYKWSARVWDKLAAVYPYRLPEPGAAARALTTLTGSEQPHLRGDWFAATASRPPFYFDFLQLPSTDRALERLVQVDAPTDVQEDAAARAGFNGSGVSRNNRILERHDAAFGAYWRSFDFSDNTGRQNIFERPLSFQPAGGEIIFNLPNGLQGYLLVDGAGRRVSKAPGDIVSDPKRPDKLVETGLSCMSCHVRGILPKDDQVRGHVLKNRDAFSPTDRDGVLALHVPAARMQTLMKDDAERFVAALTKLGVPATEPEPIVTAALRYEAVLDLATAAAETGLEVGEFAAGVRRSADLSRRLGALLARGGTVQRQVFEEAFPEAARVFQLGRGASSTTKEEGFTGHRGSVRALASSPSGLWFASGGEDRTIRVWGSPAVNSIAVLEGSGDEVLAVAFTPDETCVLSGGRDRLLRLWHIKDRREIRSFKGHTDAVLSVAVSPDGKYALSGGADRSMRLWSMKTGEEIRTFTGHSAAVSAVAFSPDGKRALSGSHDHTVRLWEVKSGKQLARWDQHEGAVYSVAFSKDGKQALSGGNDRCVLLWDAAKGEVLHRMTGHANAVIAVAFGPQGTVTSGSSRYQTADKVVRIWDRESGELRLAEKDDLEQVEAIAFAANGKWVAVSHSSGKLKVWQLGEP